MTNEFIGIPGKWCVSLPSSDRPGGPPEAGPFDSEQEARDWRAYVLTPQRRGGIVWQCPVQFPGRKGG